MPLEKLSQRNFLAGMNPDKADLLLSEQIGETFSLTNMSMTERPGALCQRKGSVYSSSVRGAADLNSVLGKSIFRFYRSTIDAQTLVSWSEGAVHGLSNITGAEVVITGSLSAAITSYAVYQDNLYMVNGSGNVYKWTGTVLSSVVLPTVGVGAFKPTLIEEHKGRMYYSGDPLLPSTVIYSEPQDPDNFESPFLSFVNVNDDDGDSITSIKSSGDNLYVFKTRNFYTLPGSPPRAVIPSEAPGIGAFSDKTVQKTRFGIIFLGNRALYLLTGNSVRNMSPQISPVTLRRIIQNSESNFSSVFHKDTYYLFFKSITSVYIDKGMSFDFSSLEYGVEFPSVSRIDKFPLISSSVFNGEQDAEEWFGCQDGTNNILRVDGSEITYYQDQANPAVLLPGQVTTKWEDADAPWQIEELRVLYLYFHKSVTELSICIEYEFKQEIKEFCTTIEIDASTWDDERWDIGLWDGSRGFQNKIVLPPGIYAERWRVTIENMNTDSPISLDGYEFGFIRHAEGL